MLLYIMEYLVPTIINSGINSKMISTISNITTNSYQIITSLMQKSNIQINTIIEKYDLERKLLLINSFIETLQSTTYSTYQKTIDISLQYLKNSISTICDLLININMTIHNHQQKWFIGWRSINIDHLLQKLEHHTSLLDKRFNELLKIVKTIK